MVRFRIQEKLPDNQLDSGRIPRTVECELSDDLVDLVVPGDVVCVSGIIKVLSTEEGKPFCSHQLSTTKKSKYLYREGQ